MKVVRLSALRTGRLYPSGNIPCTYFCYRLSRSQGHSAAGRIMSMKNCNDTTGNRTRDLTACSAVPHSTAPPRAPLLEEREANSKSGRMIKKNGSHNKGRTNLVIPSPSRQVARETNFFFLRWLLIFVDPRDRNFITSLLWCQKFLYGSYIIGYLVHP